MKKALPLFLLIAIGSTSAPVFSWGWGGGDCPYSKKKNLKEDARQQKVQKQDSSNEQQNN